MPCYQEIKYSSFIDYYLCLAHVDFSTFVNIVPNALLNTKYDFYFQESEFRAWQRGPARQQPRLPGNMWQTTAARPLASGQEQ